MKKIITIISFGIINTIVKMLDEIFSILKIRLQINMIKKKVTMKNSTD